ncbi:MAG: potassium-transporting ATPase subunit KdpA [Firmicutes bacterium]|nr:potassium-transporting ATPase subunit KdpA [Bacillota bacterium]
MKTLDVFQLLFFTGVLIVCSLPLGLYIKKVFCREATLFDFILKPVEKFIYRLMGINADAQMRWTQYAFALLSFNIAGGILLYLLLRLQNLLPLNPGSFSGMSPDLAFNTAISFVTNTNWQAYAGESTLGYLAQMAGLTVQNFLSAATGIAVAIALMRSFSGKESGTIGNFWFDATRSVLWILLPLSLIFSIVFVWQGVPQNFNKPVSIKTLEGVEQSIPQGPVASQEAIKIIGTNGGGFFNANSAHPYENPTPLASFLQVFAILIIPAALCTTFGKMMKDRRHGLVLLGAMLLLFITGVCLVTHFENAGNPEIAKILHRTSVPQMEGKEVRFGIGASSLYSVVTTSASCGAVNSMHDSFTPLSGMILMLNIGIGEIIFGGVGAGFYGIILFALLTVFIAGLMVGRTPEYLGKKIEAFEIKMVMLGVLVIPVLVLILTALSVSIDPGKAGISNPGPHGLSQVLYAYLSASGNNGSAFAGLSANTFFYNLLLGLTMLIGRFGVIIPVIAIAGAIASKKIVPVSNGTFPTTGIMFAGLLTIIILMVGALTFFPVLSLAPVAEHLKMMNGVLY